MRPVTRAARRLTVLAVAAIALAGCAGGQPQPRGYGDVNTDNKGYFGNFMLGCTGVKAVNGEYKNEKYESEEYCRCVFAGMKETVPFDEAEKFEKAQAETPKGTEITIPRNIRTVMDGCADKSSHG